jgi:uncharacterized protein (TIGR04255 family)
MAQPRNLKNPPIVEAIVNLVVRFPSPPKPETFADLAKDLGPSYHAPENRNMWQIVLGQAQAAVMPFSGPPVVNSYVFRSVDGHSVVQSKTDGFTFSALPPYKGWPDLIGGALPLWEKYRDRCLPDRVVRCSLRFINRLMLPGPIIDFDDYIIGGPKIPPELPQSLSEFSVSYVLPLNPIGAAIGRIQLAFSSNQMTESHTPVILDLDILQECDIDPMDLREVKKIFDNLRTLKNHVFFGTLTEAAVKVFE